VKKILLLLIVFQIYYAQAQSTFFDVNTIQKIEITFATPNWDYQMDTAKSGSEGYFMADQVKINNVLFDSVAIRYKGNSSYNAAYLKNPLRIKLDKFKTQHYSGITDIKLANIFDDPSMIREVLAYQILSNYMFCPKANFAMVYINGVYVGLYSNTEAIDNRFLGNVFSESKGTTIKSNPQSPGPTNRSNLKYISNDSTDYYSLYELDSKYGWQNLIDYTSNLSNESVSVPSMLDIDKAIWMLAFNNVLVNLDSYTGSFAQNHYEYLNHEGLFYSIVWDLNMCFGGFPFTGTQAGGMGALTVAGMQGLFPLLHQADDNWPLIKYLLNNNVYQKMYMAHVRTLSNEFFNNNAYQTMATNLQAIIDTAVQIDTNKFFSYSQFQNGLTTNVLVGSKTVPGITTLMQARNTYLQINSEFTKAAPIITNVTTSGTIAYNNQITIKAQIANTTNAWLAYRNNPHNKFVYTALFDDGSHNDGAASDGVFGADMLIDNFLMQYYIYAENADAGAFEPARAAYNYFTIQLTGSAPLAGQIVINELLANNQAAEVDEYGDREDWIELYNTSNKVLALGGLFVSDIKSNITKWQIPAGTFLAPDHYLVIYADDDDSLQFPLHTNYQLNANLGTVYLSNATVILDSVNYPLQLADVSFGRYPNGSGPFQNMNRTINAANNNFEIGIQPSAKPTEQFILYPNPANEYIQIEMKNNFEGVNISVYNLIGQPLIKFCSSSKINNTINTAQLQNGIYECRISNSKGIAAVKRFIVQH
jgi:hypothetical protein